jgi:hypothetical protein
MFLDDKLYNHVKNAEIIDGMDFFHVLNELFSICEEHFKPYLYEGMSGKEAKALINQVFNSWDLFVKRLKKEEHQYSYFFNKYSYKGAFMEKPELMKIYQKL